MKMMAQRLLMTMTLMITMLGIANAGGIDDALQDHFGSMVNTTQGSAYLDAVGGGFSGGSIVIRNRIVNPQWMSFQAPHINVGCGGWDIFGGSFSFISSEQLVQMLRSIASSAISYAFRLALGTISDDIETLLGKMEDKMLLKNWFGKSSCELGEQLVNSVDKGGVLKSVGDRMGEVFRTATGGNNDDSDAENPGGDDAGVVLAARNASPEEKEQLVKGNLIWRALKTQNAGAWGGVFGGDEFLEQVMSVTGTVIVCIPGEDDCPGFGGTTLIPVEKGQSGLTAYTKNPTTDLSILVNGTSGSKPAEFFDCDSGDNCFNPSPKEDVTFRGAKQRIMDILLGPGNVPGGGIIGALHRAPLAPSQMSATDQNIVQSFRGTIERVAKLAIHNEQAARNYVVLTADALAAEVLMQQIQVILGTVATSGSKLENGAAGGMIMELAGSAHTRLYTELNQIYSRTNVDAGHIAYYESLINQQRGASLPSAR